MPLYNKLKEYRAKLGGEPAGDGGIGSDIEADDKPDREGRL